jgi:hypothetical protein
MQPRDRSELVRLLVEGRFPIEPIRAELAEYPWDAEESLVLLQRTHIEAILRRYLGGELSAAQVEAWANAVELRDDIGFPDQDSPNLAHLIFVLANPAVNGDLTPESARTLLATVTSNRTLSG